MLKKTVNAFVLLILLSVTGCYQKTASTPSIATIREGSRIEVAANQPCREIREKMMAILQKHTESTGAEMSSRELSALAAKMQGDPTLEALLSCLMRKQGVPSNRYITVKDRNNEWK